MKTALAILALMMLAPFVYLGAYFLMLDGKLVVVDFGREVFEAERPQYRFGGAISEAVFFPANAFHRLLEPDRWEGERPWKSSLPISKHPDSVLGEL